MLLYEQGKNRTCVRMHAKEVGKMNEKRVKEFIEGMENGAEIALTCKDSFKVLFRCLKDDFLFLDKGEGFCIAAGNGENSRTLGVNFNSVTVSMEDTDVMKITDKWNELEIERY